jgi:hypothetical protein
MGQLVTDFRFSTADPYSYKVRSTSPDGSLPFFEEKPQIMLMSRLGCGSGCQWHPPAQVPATSGPIRHCPSL